jgi:myo-inositol 2-dehydrogenase / D-chiro-inositol 1-dehydrogenase
MVATRELRLVMIGAGWIVPFHLAALDRLGRTAVVGVASANVARAATIAEPRGAAASDDPLALVDELRPDAVYLCVPPFRAVALGEALVERAIPFLTEKPLSATDAAGPVRLAAAIERRGLVVAVGYHLRGIEALAPVRERLAANPARLVAGRWIGSTPGPAWWRRVDEGGGQVVEQATHLFDLSRLLAGEAAVAAATSVREWPAVPADADVADATAAILLYETGAVGSFVTGRRASDATVDLDLVSDGARTTIRRAVDAPGGWEIDLVDGETRRTIPAGRDPYEVQAERFLDAVVAGDPSLVLSSYGDALRTDRLTRAVVAATGQPG